ncbi:MAG: S28 family serine protease [Bacteroidales bacterium]|nr:S28 family serine protease [Bacteroidales bacterium]
MQRLIIIFFTGILLSSCAESYMSLEERLGSLEAEKIDTISADTSVFKKAFEIHLLQPVDHNDPEGEKFSQRIYLSYAGADRPVVLVTGGYGAGRNYTTELADYLDCNQIIAEHRYFGESMPENAGWEYLNTYQAASDHHRIIELFSEMFSGEWITTGISKGGQTVMYHSYYYPDDADIRIPYVAPLNFGPEDPRIYTFLDTVGSEYCRDRVLAAQKHILENRDIYYPMMLEKAAENALTFTRVGGPGAAFEYAVLEYDFAYWQWGNTSCDEILIDADPEDVFNQFFGISDISYFSDQGIEGLEPFFYQALTEIGYYGYRFDLFEDQLEYVSDSGLPDFSFSAPQGVKLDYDYELMEKVDEYVRDADNFIFIYGMQDTWSSTGVQLSGRSNSLKVMKEGGDHRTRIANLPEEQQELVLTTLKRWLAE